MADGHAEHGSALTRTRSRILAESLVNVVESCDESYVLDDSTLVLRENTVESNISAGDREIFESFVNELNLKSGEEVANNLVKKFTLKQLTRLRDVALELCRETREDCPPAKLVRRLSRKGGVRVESKFATDIIELLKFWKSGEITQQFSDLFVKGFSVKTVLSEDGSLEVENEVNLPKMLEKLEAEFSRASFVMNATIDELKCEVQTLSGKLLQRDAKIGELDSKLTALEAHRKVELER